MSGEPEVRYRRPRWWQTVLAFINCAALPILAILVFGMGPWWLVLACFLPFGAVAAVMQLRGSQRPLNEPDRAAD